MDKKNIIILILAIVIATVAGFMFWQGSQDGPGGTPQKYTGPVEKIRLGTSVLGPDQSLLIWVAEDQGYFVSNGLDVVDTSIPSTLKIQQGINSGELDLGVNTEFAYLTSILGADPVKAKIVAVIDEANATRIIGRKDKGIFTPADLKGKKIAVFRKASPEFFLGAFLISNNLSLKDVEMVDLAPDKAKDAILAGTVDAAVISQPQAYQAEKALAENSVSWFVQGNQSFSWAVISSNQFIQDHSGAIERFLNALVQAEEYVQKNPDKAQELLIKKFNLEPSYMASAWREHKFIILLDQSLLPAMEGETRWSITNKLTDKTEVPNYLNYIYFDALEKVKPEAVTIIH